MKLLGAITCAALMTQPALERTVAAFEALLEGPGSAVLTAQDLRQLREGDPLVLDSEGR